MSAVVPAVYHVAPEPVLTLKPAVEGLPSEFCVYGPLTNIHGPNLLLRPAWPGAPERYRSDGLCLDCKAWWEARAKEGR